MRHLTAVSITLLTALAGCAPTSNPSTRSFAMHTESLEQNKQLIRMLYGDCINQGRTDLLDGAVATDFVGPNGERGPSGFAATIQGLRTGFPDIHFTVEDVVAEGDRVVARWQWEGTHSGPFRGHVPSYKHVTNTGIAIYQVSAGKIVRAWTETDRLGALQQIGAIGPNATVGTAPVQTAR
jgi:predicted ester cyclase